MRERICALGFFDGVHLGHAALLRACRELAEGTGAGACVVTFRDHPDALVLGAAPALINTYRDRELLLTQWFQMDQVVGLPFDPAMRAMAWQDFLGMLEEEYQAAGFVCGADFRFGDRGEGTARLLLEYCRRRGLACRVVPEQTLEGIRVSSTYIRRQIQSGDMATAVRFLGHPHILSAQVIHGHQLGRRLGFPTANLELPQGLAAPKFGVYACKTRLEGREYLAVTNVGVRPTVGAGPATVEPWILDYAGDLYGRRITLEFYRFLRPERRFDSLDALKGQILEDAQRIRQLLS